MRAPILIVLRYLIVSPLHYLMDENCCHFNPSRSGSRYRDDNNNTLFLRWGQGRIVFEYLRTSDTLPIQPQYHHAIPLAVFLAY